MNNPILSLENIHKTYTQGKNKLTILDGASLTIKENEQITLQGPSGCGKSTLLHIAGLLDKPTKGTVTINGINCTTASDKKRTHMRRDTLGFIYQFHHLLPEFTALENIIIPQIIHKTPEKEAIENAKKILKSLKLSNRLDHRPSELSGGEQQRVAIARAVANKPALILADEPTGNLDPKTALEVFDMLLSTAKESNTSLLIVTHDSTLAKKTSNTITLKNGVLKKRQKAILNIRPQISHNMH